MKIKVSKQEVRGILLLDLKYVTAEIEYKWFYSSNQLNLRLCNLQYKVKDQQERRLHGNDYAKNKVREAMIKKLQAQGLLAVLHQEAKCFQNPHVIWWT